MKVCISWEKEERNDSGGSVAGRPHLRDSQESHLMQSSPLGWLHYSWIEYPRGDQMSPLRLCYKMALASISIGLVSLAFSLSCSEEASGSVGSCPVWWQEIEGGHQSKASENLRPPSHETPVDEILPTTTQVSLEVDSLPSWALRDLQPWSTPWSQFGERHWEGGIQLNYAQTPDAKKWWDNKCHLF